jgi:hypothetical protein
MAIDLLGIEPHKVSRDLSGYITYIYGEPKTGKTTLATKMPQALLLAFERGYNAIPGIRAQDVSTWGELKQIVRELKKPEVQNVYKSILVDTVDIASGLCEKYVCAQNGIENIGDLPYGQGWGKLKREFEETFRTIAQLGYAVVFISHMKEKTFKKKNGQEYTQVVPSCATTHNDIIKNMADIYAFAEKYEENGVAKVRLVLRSVDNSADTGSRFKYIVPSIEFDYDSLVKALNDAIDMEAKVVNNDNLFTDERDQISIAANVEYDYEGLMADFGETVGKLMTENAAYYQPRITQIVDRYLGKGKKVSEATIDQCELISLIITEIKDEFLK